MGYRPIDVALKRQAVTFVLDERRSVLSVCELLGVGPTALRRWVAEEVARRSAPPLTPSREDAYRDEVAMLRERVATLEAEQTVLKKQLPSHLERLLGKNWKSSKR